jgi:hypothetical protein
MVTQMRRPDGRSGRGLEHDEVLALGPAHGQLPLAPLLRLPVLVVGVTTMGILLDLDALGPNAVVNSVFHELITLLCTRVGDGRPSESHITRRPPRLRPGRLG